MPYARVNGNMLFYRESGDGPPAVFIHGFPLDHSLWLDQLKGLAHVRHCIALDLRGFGRSDPTVDAVLTMEMLADDVAGLLEALGVGGADVVGHSMGGYVALALWELRPDVVRSLALVDTRAGGDGAEARTGRDAMIDRILDGGSQLLPMRWCETCSAGNHRVAPRHGCDRWWRAPAMKPWSRPSRA